MSRDSFGTRRTLPGGQAYYSLPALAERLGVTLDRLPFSIRVLLENLLRNEDGQSVTEADVSALAHWPAPEALDREVAFFPARVLMPDSSGIPLLIDLASMRDAVADRGLDPRRVNPRIQTDLVIDHSVRVDFAGSPEAFGRNLALEMERNRERYSLVRWATDQYANLRVIPPGNGILHQLNLEYLASVVAMRDGVAFPDTLVGMDSHTPMINGMGIFGWGVGGIEAATAQLGQPVSLLVPRIVGCRLTGRRRPGVVCTDIVLTLTALLRRHGVLAAVVEFCGPGLDNLSLPDRATIANMAAEYGATMGFFPWDAETVRYAAATGRDADLIEAYAKTQGLWRSEREPDFQDVVEFDLGSVEPSLAGPTRPESRVPLPDVPASFRGYYRAVVEGVVDGPVSWPGLARPPTTLPLSTPEDVGGRAKPGHDTGVESGHDTGVESGHDTGVEPGHDTGVEPGHDTGVEPGHDTGVEPGDGTGAKLGHGTEAVENRPLRHGDIVIAAISSCTNTSNPFQIVTAGLLARNAVARGLRAKPWVKTSFSPGSRVVTAMLERAGLQDALQAMGFHTVGYGCMTCGGGAGPLPASITDQIAAKGLIALGVISTNRNFEGRLHPAVRGTYLASPPLVIAYAIAGSVLQDMSGALGHDAEGREVRLADLWPTDAAVQAVMDEALTPDLFRTVYGDMADGGPEWAALTAEDRPTFAWDAESLYLKRPPFLDDDGWNIADIRSARALLVLGDDVTTDHISPGGAIPADAPAGRYLIAHGVEPERFSTYVARRANHEVMVRGTFANIRLRNRMAPGTEGGFTRLMPEDEQTTVFEAAETYRARGVPLIVVAGSNYGCGSSRDWAAKGTRLLGVRVVVAQSFERIHRSNLIGMGVLPLQLPDGQSPETLGLDGSETFDVIGLDGGVTPGMALALHIHRRSGESVTLPLLCRVDTRVEAAWLRAGGILPHALLSLENEATTTTAGGDD